jgi:hypothetical protein
MTRKRNRAKQTTTLEERISSFTASLQQQAEKNPTNKEEAVQLRKRISSCQTALSLNHTLNSRR